MMKPSNPTLQDQQFLAKTHTTDAPVWVKPQLTATPMREALSGGSNAVDGFTGASLFTRSS